LLADAPVESGLLSFDLLVHRKQAIDDGAQQVSIEQAPRVVAELAFYREIGLAESSVKLVCTLPYMSALFSARIRRPILEMQY
jgi:hypothetical protein